jgi:predicted phosphodiesterase
MKIGLLADAHGVIEAFDQAMSVLEDAGADTVYFLGDAVGYFPGTGVLSRVRDSGMQTVMGNHEHMLVLETFSDQQDRSYRLRETRAAMDRDTLEWVQTWPATRLIEAGKATLHLMHGSPEDPIYGYVYPDTDLSGFSVEQGATVFMANTHRPFIRDYEGVRFINVGSCGMPRDCGNLGAVCIFDDQTREARILRFDIEEALRSATARCGIAAPDVLALAQRRGTAFGEHV